MQLLKAKFQAKSFTIFAKWLHRKFRSSNLTLAMLAMHMAKRIKFRQMKMTNETNEFRPAQDISNKRKTTVKTITITKSSQC